MDKELINIYSKKKLTNIILVLYFSSLFLDLHLFYNKYSTLIRVGIISLLFVVLFFKYSTKKDKKIILIYLFFYLIYSIVHLLNIRCSMLNESLYLLKMIQGVLIIYIVNKLSVDLKSFEKTMNWCLLLICGSVVICNIFKIGYTAYDFSRLKYSIFSWPKSHYNYLLFSSKGFFHATNQIIAIILLYLPLLISNLKDNLNLKNIMLILISLLALLMLGNRISSYGPIIILLVAILGYLFLAVIKKEKIKHSFLTVMFLLLTIFLCILKNAPINERNKYYDDLLNNSTSTYETGNSDEEIDSTIINEDREDIYDLFNQKLVNTNFPKKYYPYEKDPEFWHEMLKKDKSILVNSRYIEQEIIKRVVEINNNQAKDKYLGIGYSRIMNIQNIEQDYIMQYYSLGIIGLIIILGVYFSLFLYICIKMLLDFETKFNYKNIMLLLAIGFILLSAYFSGNLLNSISIIIPLNFVIGIAMVEINKKENNYPDMILGFKTYNKGKNQLLKDISMDDSKQIIIYNINPLIVSNFYNNRDYVKEFNNQKYNIPDGFGVILASKLRDGNINKQIPGIELMKDLCKLSEEKNYKVYLYGAKKEVVKKTKEKLEDKYQKINIVGFTDGYVKSEVALKDIIKNKPDVLFVALGSPKQEEFIIENKKALENVKIIMPVGGSFDVISGYSKRSPKIFIKLHLEWLYRMFKEPKRIKRNVGIIKFLWLVIFKNNWYNNKRKGVVK